LDLSSGEEWGERLCTRTRCNDAQAVERLENLWRRVDVLDPQGLGSQLSDPIRFGLAVLAQR
jgi:hypothetical protein